VIAAVEEERLSRVKHQAGFPLEAVRFCLAQGGLDLGDLSCIAINSSSAARCFAKIAYALKARPSLAFP
jgi:carbamoyltransferase